MSEMPAALNEFRYRLELWLEQYNIPLQARNTKLSVAPDARWARLSVLNVDSKNACLGQTWIRDRGIFVVSLFFPLGGGSVEEDEICYALRDHFSEWRYNYLELGTGEVKEVPSTEDFYHINVNLPYRHK